MGCIVIKHGSCGKRQKRSELETNLPAPDEHPETTDDIAATNNRIFFIFLWSR